jgi:hypothetical protein
LAAAGIRVGSHVTYHIRNPASKNDEMVFTTVNGASSCNVLNEEESPPIDLAPGLYEVFVDLQDGNIHRADKVAIAFIDDCHLEVKLEVH